LVRAIFSRSPSLIATSSNQRGPIGDVDPVPALRFEGNESRLGEAVSRIRREQLGAPPTPARA